MRDFIKGKIIFFILIFIELVALLICGRRALREPVVIEFAGEQFADISEEKTAVVGDSFAIHSGAAYELRAYYKAEVTGDSAAPCKISMYADDGEYSELKQNELSLNPARNYVYGRVYSEGSGNGGVVVRLFPGSRLDIERITVTERPVWQWVKLILLLLLFALVDLALVMETKVWKWLDWNKAGIILIMALSAVPLLINYNYTGHDLWYHGIRIDLVAKELADGNFPVRLYSHAYNGFGYAGPIFYGDVMLYLPAVLYNLMIPMEICIKVLIFVSNIITVLTSYYLGKGITRKPVLGLVCSLAYTFSPYRLICIYNRGAVGEYLALAFLPLIALGMYMIYETQEFDLKNSVILAAGVGCTLMCHVLSVELAMIPMVLGALILWKKTIKKEIFKSLSCAVLICIGFAAWYIVPFLHTMFGPGVKAFGAETEAPIQETGAYLIQLLNPFFPSFGGASPNTMKGDMSMSLGMGAICGLVLVSYMLLDSKIGSKRRVSGSLKLVFGLGCFGAFMTSIYFPWDYISRVFGNHIAKLVNECQFSCRHLGATVLLLVMAFVLAINELVDNEMPVKEIYKGAVVAFVVGSVVTTGLFFNGYFSEIDANRSYSVSDSSADYIYNYFSIEGETAGVGDDKADLALNAGVAEVDKSSGAEVSYTLPVYAFLNIRVEDADSKVAFATSKDKSGMLSVKVPAGYKGKLAVVYKEPLLWRICELITIFTCITVVIFIKKKRIVESV